MCMTGDPYQEPRYSGEDSQQRVHEVLLAQGLAKHDTDERRNAGEKCGEDKQHFIDNLGTPCD